MSGTSLDDVVKRLSTSDLEAKDRLEAATSLRDSLDHYTSGQLYTVVLKRLMPVFINILRGPCIYQSNSPEQKLRHCILEILHRLPTAPAPTEPFEPYAQETCELLMQLVRNDNEDNATLCVKITSDIMRHQHKALQAKVQDFLSLIQELFEQMPKVVREQLDNAPSATLGQSGAPSTPGSQQTNFQSPRPASPVVSVPDLAADAQQQNRPLLRGMQSFKVLSECPIIVVSIFQIYRATVPQNVKAFVPLIKNVLLLQANAQKQAHADAAARGQTHTGVSSGIKNRAAFGEFITAQVKTMSFLAYIMRQYSSHLNDFLPALPNVIVRLLRDCPRDKSAARKELLIAIRHIINYNFRKLFVPIIDDLLDERTLTGDGLTVYETMRPLAFSMLADLIHHVRDSLGPDQIRKTVEVYTKNLQDSFPGTSFQTMSAKLLLNMAECIAKLPNKVDARHYHMLILNAIGDKFAAMNRQYPNAVKLSKQYHQQAETGISETYLADKEHPPDWDETDIFSAVPIKISNPRDRGADPVVDNKFLFRNLMNGLKNTFYQLRACNVAPPIDPQFAPSHWQDVSYGFTAEEVNIIIKLFREGAHVFRYYEIEKPVSESQYSSPVEQMANFYMISSSKEEKDLLETFATVFHCIDPATFHEVFQQEIPKLYEMIFEHTALLHIPQFFLASEATSPSFCGMLLQFLMEHIDEVGSADVRKSSILLRLFKLAFMAVTLFAAQNEQVLLPHVVNIVTKSIELSTKAEEPINYFLLLRSLFRSIGGGKFEQLYKQILPLLEMLLDVLNTLLMAARKPSERDLYVELCLTVPARLSHLLPHLSFLMRPLVVALRAGTELVGQGLRTLELCVDNLTADYLDPIMAPVIDELMSALFSHLKPHPYSHFHAHTTMRILGKLGGRNRKFMTAAVPLTYKEYSDDASSFDVRLVGSKWDRAFPADLGIESAIQKLMEAPRTNKNPQNRQHDDFYKKQSLHLIKSQLKLRIGYDQLPDDLPRIVRLQAQDFISKKLDINFLPFETSNRDKSIAKKDEQDQVTKNLLKAIMFAESIPDLGEEDDAFLVEICRHFTIIEIGRALVDIKRTFNAFDPKAGEGPLFIDSRVLCDAIVESLASDHPDVREAAKKAIREVHKTASIILGSELHVGRLPLFTHLSNTFCHSCYEEEWFTKSGGSLGINFMLTELDFGDAWVASKQTEFIRALMYVIKDMPQDLPEKTRRLAQETLEVLLRRITRHIKKEDAMPIAQQPGQPPPKQTRLAQICMQFNSELAHMNKFVRETSKQSLELIAKAAGCEVWELIDPYKERFLQPIYSKPLRALPFSTQIGYINAMTYHMSLKHDKVNLDENLNRLLMESLALADAQDDSLANKPAEYRTHQHIVNLRVSCIKLLSTAMTFEEFANSPTKPRILQVFFKCLYSESKPTIAAANDALKLVLAVDRRLPKDLLQGGLRPVLASLSDPKRLTVHGLENLSRLLKLLNSYFKVEIGVRLLDQIYSIVEPGAWQQISFTFCEQNPQMKVITAVLNIFHLLPSPAESFKERLIENFLELEDKLRRTIQSPFRAPIYLYLNRYPKEIWKHLVGKLHELKFGRLLAQVLSHPDSSPLREVAAEGVDALVSRCNEVMSEGGEKKFIAIVNSIHILDSISQWHNACGWMNKKETISWLKTIGKELESHIRNYTLPADLRLPAYQAAEQLMTVLIKSLERNPTDLDSLFSLIESITGGELRATHALYHFLYEKIISNDSIEFWKTTVLRCLDMYAGKMVSNKTKHFLLHYIVNPIVAMDVMRHWNSGDTNKGPRFLDRSVIDAVSSKIWKVHPDEMTAEDATQPGIDHTRFEVLQLSAMLVKYYHTTISDTRKDIIKFGWTFIRLDDVINKHAAYVVIGYFIAHYDTPPKIVNQVYLSLLKTNQNEGRALVTQALELIAPVLPKRCSSGPADRKGCNERGTAYAQPWAMAPRRVLSDEGHNVQQMSSIFQFLVRHPELFYDVRDNKKLALNMMWLIWTKRKFEGMDQATPTSPPAVRQTGSSERSEFQISQMFRQKMMKYLVEFIAQLNERYQLPSARPREHNPSSVPQTQPHYWGDLDIDLFPNVTDVILCGEKTQTTLNAEPSDKEKYDERFLTNIINTLQVVRIIINFKSDDWIQRNIAAVQKVLEKNIKYDDGRLLKSIIQRVLDAVPEDAPMEDADAEGETEAQTSSYISGVNLLWSLGKRKPAHYSALAAPAAGELSAYDLEIQIKLMIKEIQTVAVLATLVEKSMNIELCTEILNMVEGWVFRSEGSWPTLKEKTAFLDLVIRIYEDPKIARTELTVRMEHAFLIGMRASDVDMRNRFMAIFDRSLSRTASASQFLLGAIISASQLAAVYPRDGKDLREASNMADDKFELLMAGHRRFVAELGEHIDMTLAHRLWRGMVALLTKDYHNRQMDKRPNVVQSLVEGAVKTPGCRLPPHVLKFLAKTFDVWYTALVHLEDAAVNPQKDSAPVRESNLNALVKLYALLKEDDLFYGTWRRRCQFVETNAGLSYEQNGMWDRAQKLYETAQIKARTGRLQQWEILQDLAKHENYQDLLLECAWRNMDMWQEAQHREACFMSLLKLHNQQETANDFARVCDEAIQLSIRKWHQLPERLTNAHVPILQNFQQMVELHDASVICQSLANTNASNLDSKSTELKMLLAGWRERLPNVWDDITAWQDLVTWRQHIFNLINQTYLQLLPPQNQQNAAAGANSFAYRGYHETAWIINRFAHVARKHSLPEVCISQLSRIYTLPNIEIQEAFLKLREQAKCHYESAEELSNGLDVINNTNLSYFNQQQKAEFFTLKGMFLEKLGQKSEADSSFGTALYYDIGAAKAWAEWGYFNDRKFKEDPTDLNAARQALTSYLQAAGSYKNGKSRKLLARILWLLSIDDDKGTIAMGFDDYKGETPVWYWITFIPQLLTGLGHKEAPRVFNILLNIAKSYPQALYFQLRTSREDMHIIKKNQEAKERARQQQAQQNRPDGSRAASRPGTANGTASGAEATPARSDGGDAGPQSSRAGSQAQEQQPQGPGHKKHPWELTDEVMSVLKTAFPLLALSMETMVDQIQKNFKCPPDEDAYRLIVALLNDALTYVSRTPASFAKSVKLPSATETNITRFAENILPSHIKKSFEADFVKVKPTMYEYIHKLRRWRSKFEEKLDRRVRHAPLESFSPHLSEFRYQKFDEVEVPGQYLQHKDRNQDFIRIERFLPNVDLVRSYSASYRRLKMRGHDGSVHAWAVQHPAARHCRREERVAQLFRQLNQTLSRKKESRRRDLQFTLPLMVPLAPHIRIVQEDTSYVTLQAVYEDHCRLVGLRKDEPVLFTLDKLRGVLESKNQLGKAELAPAARLEVMKAVQAKWVPGTVALEYFQQVFPQFAEFWLFRRQFSYQLAALSFMTYIVFMQNRNPFKMSISRASGNIWGSELISFMSVTKPLFVSVEPVPFRLTPSLQVLMGPLATEGIFGCSLMAIARCLTEPQQELEHALTLFVRDEVICWMTSSHRNAISENQLRESVQVNSDSILKRALSLAHNPSGNLPANQTVIDAISKAVNPMNLAQCDALWMPYL
ncbi:hypothetical protein CDD81_1373 [Ophiocordyceps australis]|uniref:Non-specific serine/threonine protein kinase n=1 Tax=Ophiocordyceps australis TaxID=1399860 RepID=A0A2C5Y0A4_9HYPO|nr:hypothetical protein CDD81_1373 [Ophiocordyceps australis]